MVFAHILIPEDKGDGPRSDMVHLIHTLFLGLLLYMESKERAIRKIIHKVRHWSDDSLRVSRGTKHPSPLIFINCGRRSCEDTLGPLLHMDKVEWVIRKKNTYSKKMVR